MSQAGDIDVLGNNPNIPTTFVTDDGDAVPIANTLEILGTYVAAGTTPVETTGSGNTVTIEVQTAQAIAATDVTKIGLASFSSSQFSVDANGFVTLSGGGQAIDSIGTQTGTNPIVPTVAGLVTINGAVVAAGTNPVRSNGTGANTMAIQVQISQAIAASDATKIGLSNFNSAQFSVDANGFVSITAGVGTLQTLTGNTGGAISPVLGNINTIGTGSITIDGAGNTLTTQLTGLTNHAVLVGAGTATITNVGPTATAGQVLQSAGAAADPTFSTATYPSTTTINQLLYSSAANVVGGVTGVVRSVLTTTSSGVPIWRQVGDGQIIIGSSASNPIAASITSSDSSVTITPGANSISLTVTGGATATKTLTPDLDFDGTAATPVSPQAGNINILSYNPAVASVTNTYNSTGAATGNLQVEHKAWLTALVVDPSTTIGSRGTFSTIASALTAASSGQTIFIRPGTYTENLTLKAGVNLTSFESSSSLNATGGVIISGTCTFTAAGSVTISGIQLQTNAAAFLAVTGAAASVVNLNNCYLNCTNATGITFSSSSASSRINLYYCNGNLGTVGIALFTHSSSGAMNMNYCNISDTGASVTNSTASAGELNLFFCYITIPITTSSTNFFQDRQCHHNTSDNNTTALTIGGSAVNILRGSTVTSGTASAISIGSSLLCDGVNVSSSNTNAIIGAGSITYNAIHFGNNSSNITTTTQALMAIGPSASVGSTNSGNTNTLTVTNDSNTATSSAKIVSSVAGSTAADPVYQANVLGTTTWTWGIDNSVTSPTADPWVLSQGTALGTNDVMSVATSGEINYPLQSAFSAYVGSSVANATGDGTVVTVIAGTEIFDQNSDYNNATGVFTAPVTGRYRFACGCQLGSLGAGNTMVNYQIVTSNRSADIFRVNGANCRDGTGTNLLTGNGSVLIDMDAADTMTFTVAAYASTKTVSINGTGGVNMNTFITGQLEC